MNEIFEIKFPIELVVKEKVILKFSNKQGGDYNIFSYYWQCFVWAATIGFLRNERRTLASGTERIFSLKTMMGNDGERDAQALICMCIARYGSIDIMKEPQEAIRFISEYANAGFYHIMQLMENGENTFNDMEKVKQEIFAREYDDNQNTAMVGSVEDDYVVPEATYEQPVYQELPSDTEHPWTNEELEILYAYHDNNAEVSRIAERLRRSVVSVEKKMASLGLITIPSDLTVTNTANNKGLLLDSEGNEIYSVEGQLKILRGKIYRFNLKRECLTVKGLIHTDDGWCKTEKLLVAYPKSDLYPLLKRDKFVDVVEDFFEGEVFEENKIKVNGVWFYYNGNSIYEERPQAQIQSEDKPTSRKRWTATERSTLISFFESGMSVAQLADYFNTEESHINDLLKKLRLI